jgi:hypothetical protein
MTSADIMILSYPVLAGAAMAAAAVGMVYFFGYNKHVIRRGDATRTSSDPDPGERSHVDGVYMRLTDAEAARLLADRAAQAAREPERMTT